MKETKVIVLLILIQLVICAFAINEFPISLDEPFSIFHAQFPLNDMLPELAKGNNSPLHFILLHYWIKIFGISAIAVRSLSVLISVFTITILYRFLRKLWKPEYAILPVILFMFSRLNHLVAMEARMYGLFTLFFVLILSDLYAFIINDKKVFIRLGIWNALLLYTHYLGGVVIVMECITLVFFVSYLNKEKLKQIVYAFLIGIILFIPGIQLFISRASEFSNSGTWVPETRVIDLWTNLVKLLNNQFTLITIVIIIISALFIARKMKSVGIVADKEVVLFFSIWFLGSYFIMFLISIIIQPLFFIKYLQFLSIPLFVLCFALVFQFDFKGKLNYYAYLLVLPFLLSFKLIPDVNRQTDELIDYIKANKDDQTVVYFCPPHYDLTVAYHYDRKLFERKDQLTIALENEQIYSVYNAEDLKITSEYSQIAFIDFESNFLYPNNGILARLDSTCTFIQSKAFNGNFNVYYYKY